MVPKSFRFMERELGKSLKVTGWNFYHIQVDQSNFLTPAWGFQLGLGGKR